MLGLSDVTQMSRVWSLTARELPLAVKGYLVYCNLEESQNVDDNIYNDNLIKDKIDDDTKNRSEENTHTEESQGVDDNISDDQKEIILWVDVLSDDNENIIQQK